MPWHRFRLLARAGQAPNCEPPARDSRGWNPGSATPTPPALPAVRSSHINEKLLQKFSDQLNNIREPDGQKLVQGLRLGRELG